MGMFSGISINPFSFEKEARVELTPRDINGVFRLLQVTDRAPGNLEVSRDHMLEQQGLVAPAAIAIEHTPPPRSPAEIIDGMLGFEATRQPTLVTESEVSVDATHVPTATQDMQAAARAQLAAIYAKQGDNGAGAHYDQEAA